MDIEKKTRDIVCFGTLRKGQIFKQKYSLSDRDYCFFMKTENTGTSGSHAVVAVCISGPRKGNLYTQFSFDEGTRVEIVDLVAREI